MTTVAWDGCTLAADRMVGGTYRGASACKLRRAQNGRLLAVSGTCDACAVFLDWLEHGGERPAWQQRDDVAVSGMEVMPDGRVFLHGAYGRYEALERPIALGSGTAYAMAAMHLGHDARRAVEVACELDVHSAGPVDTLTLEPAHA